MDKPNLPSVGASSPVGASSSSTPPTPPPTPVPPTPPPTPVPPTPPVSSPVSGATTSSSQETLTEKSKEPKKEKKVINPEENNQELIAIAESVPLKGSSVRIEWARSILIHHKEIVSKYLKDKKVLPIEASWWIRNEKKIPEALPAYFNSEDKDSES